MKTNLQAMKNVFLIAILFVIIAGCTKDPDYKTNVFIRVENNSTFDYASLKVSPGDELWEVGDLPAGVKSAYRDFNRAYGYGYIEAVIDGKIYRMIPIDYVGATPLKKGYYTYQIVSEN